MEAWIRFERWALGTLGVLWLACVGYAISEGGITQPVPELPQPSKILKKPNSTSVYYEIPSDKGAIPYDLDISLQIKGFKRPQGTWPGFYQKSREEYIHVYQGRVITIPSGQVTVAYDPQKITVLHVLRQRTWGSAWRRMQLNWERNKKMKAQQQALRTFP